MAFPTVAASSSGNSGGKRTSHTITLPAGIAAGNVLVLFFYANGAVAGSTPAGWTAAVAGRLFWRLATGSEGSTLTITTASSVGSAFAAYRLTGAGPDPVGGLVSASGTSTHPQAGALATGVSKDYLWLSAIGWDGNVSLSVAGYPDDLETSRYANVNGGGAALSSRSFTGTSSTDSVGTLSASTDWVAYNVAIRPPELRSGSFTDTGAGNQSFAWAEAHPGTFAESGAGDLALEWSEGHQAALPVESGAGTVTIEYLAESTAPPLTTPSSPVIWIIDAPTWDLTP